MNFLTTVLEYSNNRTWSIIMISQKPKPSQITADSLLVLPWKLPDLWFLIFFSNKWDQRIFCCKNSQNPKTEDSLLLIYLQILELEVSNKIKYLPNSRMCLKSMKKRKSQRCQTCSQLNLETLGSRSIMLKNLPGHCSEQCLSLLVWDNLSNYLIIPEFLNMAPRHATTTMWTII